MIPAKQITEHGRVPEGWERKAASYQVNATVRAKETPKAHSLSLQEQEKRFADRLENDRRWAIREGLL